MAAEIEAYHRGNSVNKIKPYLKNMIYDLQIYDTQKIQSTISINFISSRDAEEECVMHSRSNIIKFKSYNNVNEVLDELFDSFCSRYQRNLETSIRGSDFIFDSIQMMYYKILQVQFRRDS